MHTPLDLLQREETDTVFWTSNWWQQVSGTATQGLQITIVGMSLVFFTLGLIILILILLTRLPGLRANSKEQKSDPGKQAPPSQPTVDHATAYPAAASNAELAQVAAIAVALVYSHRPTTKRSRTQTTGGKWKQYGRAHQLGL